MKILIDNSNLVAGGGIQVATSFINDLKMINNENLYCVVQSSNSAKEINKDEFPDLFLFYDLDQQCIKSKYKRAKALQQIENVFKPDVIFTVFGPSYYKSKCPKVVGFAIPYIIYPNSPFFSKISLLERLKYKVLSVLKSYYFNKNSDALIVETDNAREVYLEKKNADIEIYTVNNTLNEIFFNEKLWNNFSLKEKTYNILCLTANYAHKNLDIIPDVIDVLIKKYNFNNFKFQITLSQDEMQLDAKYDNYINYLGRVPLRSIPALYEQVDVVFIPTLLEVFSATYLEAMFMGKPIVASDMPFSRDICGNAAIYCSPLDPEKYADAIIEIYNNNNLREELITKGTENLKRFGTSMDRSKSYLNIIKKTMEDAKNKR